MPSRLDNGPAPVIQGCPLDDDPATRREAEHIVALMRRHGLSCGNLGGHTYGSLSRHHHHDYTCLIEAAVAEPNRLLTKVRADIDRLEERSRRHHTEMNNMHESVATLQKMVNWLRSYIDNTPDPSGDGSVGDHFRDWLRRHA